MASLVSAGGNLLGGLLGDRSARRQSNKALGYQNEWNVRAENFAREQFGVAQKQFNDLLYRQDQQARLRVADAKAAGLHPLYALGASSSITPTVSAGGFSPGGAPSPVGTELGGAIGRAGEAIARGIEGREMAKRQKAADLLAVRDHDLRYRQGIAAAQADYARAAYYESMARMQERRFHDMKGVPSGAPGGGNPELPKEKVHSQPYGGSMQTPGGRFRQGDTTTAERFEREYGDVGAAGYGLWRLLDDAGSNLGEWLFEKLHGD